MTPTALTELLTAQYQRYPALEPQDIYKLLYQAVFGPEHSIDNLQAAEKRLYLEILHLPITPTTTPLLEPLSTKLCRVNLRPFMHQGGDVRRLWHLVRETVRLYTPGTLDDLQRTWKIFLTTPWAQRYAAAVLERFWLHMATEHFPAVHHSRAYTAAYAPHYRIILQALVETPTFPLC